MIALIKLAAVFAGIVFLLSRRWNLGIVLLLAAVAIGLLFSHPLLEVGCDVILASVDLLALRLALAIVLIMTLGELLHETAATENIVKALQALVPDGRVVIAALPMLIGLLPSVGGAMFSAPMVDAVGERLEVDGGRRTFVNYWFRHVWEPIFPLYPSLLLAAVLLGLTPARLAVATWPLTVAAIAGGVFLGLPGVPRRGGAGAACPRVHWLQSLGALLRGIWPVVLVVALSLLLPAAGGWLSLPIDERASLILGLVVTVCLVLLVNRVPLLVLGTILRHRVPWKTVVIVLGTLAFRRVLENSGAVLAVSEGLAELEVPLALVAFAVPFVPGLLTGLVVAAFGIGFPVVLPLVVAQGGGLTPEWVAWLVAGGYVGTMCSPMHLCLTLTRVYFRADWRALYLKIVPAALVVAAVAAVPLLLPA